MAVTSWSNTGAANPQGVQLAMEEIKMEQKLDALPDPSRAFDWVSCNDDRSKTDTLTNLGFSFCEGGLGLKIWR